MIKHFVPLFVLEGRSGGANANSSAVAELFGQPSCALSKDHKGKVMVETFATPITSLACFRHRVHVGGESCRERLWKKGARAHPESETSEEDPISAK
jgi:hypothetical protein